MQRRNVKIEKTVTDAKLSSFNVNYPGVGAELTKFRYTNVVGENVAFSMVYWTLQISRIFFFYFDRLKHRFGPLCVIERAEVTKSTGSETNRNSGYVDSLLFSVLNPSIKSSFGSGSSRSSTASNLPFTELSCTRTSVSSPSYSRSGVENASVCSFVSHHLRDKLSPAKSSCPLSSSRVGFESESNCSSTESFVSPVVSSKTSSSSDSSSSDELLLTMREKTPTSNTLVNDGLSPGFAGFETSPATVAKLAEFKGIVGEVLTPNLSSGLSPISGHSLSNDSGIGEARLVERLSLRSMEQNAMSYSRRRSSGILRKDTSTRLRKSVRFDSVSKFETLPEEKAEDSAEMDEKADSVKPEIVPHNPENKVHFTERRRKRCPLPTLSEADTETDEGFGGSQNSILSCISSVREDNQTLVRSPIFLAKGKKWRRSFLMLKNVRDRGFNPDLSEEENKGRCWRQNMEQLIQSQSESTMLHRELDECTVLRTGFDGKTTSGFEEGDTLTEKSIYSRRSRFSLSISVDRSLRHEISHHNSILEESSLARLALESRESCLTDVNVSAGDHFRNRSLPQIDFGASHTVRDIVLLYCQQSQPLPFDECFDESVLRSCRKIGEGVYGEVFSLKTRSKSSVIKIIPIEGDQKVNGERQKRFDEILSELVISLELSNLRKREDYYTNCFAEVQRCWCVQGRYPTRLISLWKEYDQTKGSDNDSPKIFRDDQLYIILELNNGGEDLKSFEFNNAQQTLSVFKQVANALAVAEQAFKFEHRDLHWGNVLVSPTKDRESTFIFGDKTRNVQLFGVKVTIIDYTLSRISVNNHTLYNNIGEDPDLFTAEGDFQFEVYRLMRKEVDDTWDRYVPKTNLLWLYYLIDKMINEVRYRRDYTKIHQTNVGKLRRLHASVLDFESSCDLVENQAI